MRLRLLPFLLIANIISIGCGGPTQVSGGAAVPASSIPAAAQAVGYTTHTFSTTNFTASNVDTGLTYNRGYQWYFSNFFNTQGSTSGTTLNADGTISNGNLRDANGNLIAKGSNGAVASIGAIPSSPYFVGTAFGCGGYFTAEIVFDPAANMPDDAGWQSWWSMSHEHLTVVQNYSADHWTGQTPAYKHFGEVDFFEWLRGGDTFQSALHDWYGNFNQTCDPGSYVYCNVASNPDSVGKPAQIDWTVYHRYAALWVPATSTTQGYVKFFFDDVNYGSTFYWSQYTNQPPVPTTSSPWLYGIIDQQHLALLFGSGSSPMTVRSIDVWQGDGACNVTN